MIDALSMLGDIAEWSGSDTDAEIVEEACQVLGNRCGLEEDLKKVMHQAELGDGVLVGRIGQDTQVM